MNSIPWLRLNGIKFNRGKRPILSDISLQIKDREITLLTGHNGSGKTTLLRILAGLLTPDSAIVELVGHKKTDNWKRSKAILRENSCYLHQDPYLFDASVFDNVAYGLRRRGVDAATIERLVTGTLEATALDHLRLRHANALSSGEKQRVAMVRAWVLKPRLMLLDEPVVNMDKPSRRQCLALINQMQRDNIAVMLTSHDPQQGELEIGRHLHLYQCRMINKKTPTGIDEPPTPEIQKISERRT